MQGKIVAIIVAVVAVLGLVVGGWGAALFYGQKQEKAVAQAVQTEQANCAKVTAERDSLATRAKLMELHLRLGHIAIQAGRMNYGLARTEAATFFDDVAKYLEESKGSKHEGDLRMILEKKDSILGDLAVGNPAQTRSRRSTSRLSRRRGNRPGVVGCRSSVFSLRPVSAR
jgi:hypothetical protein